MKAEKSIENTVLRIIIAFITVISCCFVIPLAAFAEDAAVPAPGYLLQVYNNYNEDTISMTLYKDNNLSESDTIQIFRKINDEEWTMCTELPASVFSENAYYTYTENAQESGRYQYKYRYCRGGIAGEFSNVGDYSTLTWIKTPEIVSVTSNGTETTVCWKKDDFVTSYRLKVSSDSGFWWIIGDYEIEGDKTSYTYKISDVYLEEEDIYCSLKAENDDASSAGAYFNPGNLSTPQVRSGLKTSSSRIHLCWEKVHGDASYMIYRYDSSSKDYVLIDTISGAAAAASSYIDSGKTPDTAYSYRVKACKTSGNIAAESDFSRIITVYTHPGAVKKSAKAKLKQNKTKTLAYNLYNTTDFIDHKGYYSVVYEKGKYIYIRRINGKTLKPVKTIKIKKKYPEFGNAICDKKGNYYIAWGSSNSTEKRSKVTFAVSKYNYSGKHIKTAKGSASLNVKSPFHAGTCSMAFDGNKLVCSFARLMYKMSDGINHQASQVFAVNTKNMKKVGGYHNYASHSFDQRIIGLDGGGVLFADLGDAYPRGFRLNDNKKVSETVFHFYGEIGNNSTNSTLGDIASVSSGYILTGTSGKSLKSLNGKRQLFAQLINPYTGKSLLKASTRTGTSGGKKATDVGIKWLTNYQDKSDIYDVKTVELDKERILIMWDRVGGKKKANGAYYMIMTPSCEILKKPTRIGNVKLNTNSRLHVKGNYIYWSSYDYTKTYNERLIINRLQLPKL